MRGRFRKGKKAFKLHRGTPLSRRYERYLDKLAIQRELALKGLRGAMISVMGAMQVRKIMGTPTRTQEDKIRKAHAVLDTAIDTAEAIMKMYGVENKPMSEYESATFYPK